MNKVPLIILFLASPLACTPKHESSEVDAKQVGIYQGPISLSLTISQIKWFADNNAELKRVVYTPYEVNCKKLGDQLKIEAAHGKSSLDEIARFMVSQIDGDPQKSRANFFLSLKTTCGQQQSAIATVLDLLKNWPGEEVNFKRTFTTPGVQKELGSKFKTAFASIR